MKNLNKIFLAAIVMVGFATSANAQATASASATATIVTPISIAKNVDMNFGKIAVQVSAGGTVALSDDGSNTRTLGGTGLTLPAITGTVTEAQFTVTGVAGYLYNITLPSTATLANGSHTMTAGSFIHSSAGTLDATLGTESFYVGATLTVTANQAAGVYVTASPFNVIVNYN